MSQHMQFDEIESGYQATPPPNYEYPSNYDGRLGPQQNFARWNIKSRVSSPASWQSLMVAMVSLLVLIVLAYMLLFNIYEDGNNSDSGRTFTRLFALIFLAITLIIINFVFNRRK